MANKTLSTKSRIHNTGRQSTIKNVSKVVYKNDIQKFHNKGILDDRQNLDRRDVFNRNTTNRMGQKFQDNVVRSALMRITAIKL